MKFLNIVTASLFLALTIPASAAPIEMCGNRSTTAEKTCVVDGDTIWLQGENIRLKEFNTPEPNHGNSICPSGGTELEDELADVASARLLELLNGKNWTIERFGLDSIQDKRRLATIRQDGQDVRDILIGEGLARHWPDGARSWCQ